MKIPIEKYVMDESLSWEERYRQLEKHHEEETSWMIGEIERLETPPHARPATMKSAEIDALIAAGVASGGGFPVRKFYGLEFRGLLGDIVRGMSVRPTDEEGLYDVTMVLVMRCVESGVANREVIFEGPVHYTAGEGHNDLTPQQHIAATLARHMMQHEAEEDIRLDGKYIWEPTHYWAVKTRI